MNNTSEEYYESAYYKKHKKDVQPVPKPRSTPPQIKLDDIVGPDVLGPIETAKRLSFHAVGDTGAAKVNRSQKMATAILHEAGVADAMSGDLGSPESPAFFFHLGDVIYNFGEGQYYYDQFYEPFRNYDRPIFAIPGNHDGAVFGPSEDTPTVETLTAFLRNFCAASPGSAEDAAGLMRSTMTQPGVYFTLDAPFVSVIGLYSNVLEGPGVISSQGGLFPTVGDEQLEFLKAELKRLKPERDAGKRAVLIACHHPPASIDSKHGGSEGIDADIDSACGDAGLWPDAVISGHAHLYQRFTRRVEGREIPYVVAGAGGYSATHPVHAVKAPATDGEYTLVADPIVSFGYLTVTADIGVQRLTIAYKPIDSTVAGETVAVDLKKGVLV
ncbi:MAG TPA: metallophosphoesterase [Solirubrobacterales bacterium]|nr:metallophosphoesterase [Solirubrobacterales bacterium]